MSDRFERSVRHVLTAGCIAAAAAVLGVALAPAPAVAANAKEMTGWTCYQWDACHSGSRDCCFEIIDVPPGQGRCSTACGDT